MNPETMSPDDRRAGKWQESAPILITGGLGLEPPLHRRRVSCFQIIRAFSIDQARRLLGFQPQMQLRDALRSTIGWYQANGWL